MSKTVVGLFRNMHAAEAVVQELENSGFTHDHVSIVAGNHQEKTASGSGEYSGGETSSDTGGGVARGAAVGGGIGLVAGLIALAIPGIGPVLAAGPIAAALTGLGVGAAAGGVIGGLSHVGIPDEEYSHYASRLKGGEVLVSVHADDSDAERAKAILHSHGGTDADNEGNRDSMIRTYDRPSRSGSTDDFDTSGSTRSGERTSGFGKTAGTLAGMGAAGSALSGTADRLGGDTRRDFESTGKGVWDETKEKVREGWDKTKQAASDSTHSGDLRSAETGDNLEHNARKDWESTGSNAWQETKDKAREGWDKTKDALGGTSHSDVSRDAESGRWGASDGDYQSHYQQRYSGLGQNYDYYAPAYGMGSTAANRHTGREWSDAEPEIRRDWESKGTGAWEEVKDAVRHGWNSVRGTVSGAGR